MKKVSKVMLGIAGFCIVVGTGLVIGSGAVNHVFRGDTSLQDSILMDAMDDLGLGNLEIGFRKDLAGTEISNLDVDVKLVTLNVVRDENVKKISISSDSGYVDYHCSVNGEDMELTIQRKERYQKITSKEAIHVTLTVPADHEFDEVAVTLDVASMNTEGFTAEELELNLNAASVDLEEISVNQLDLDINVGKALVQGDVKQELNVDCNVGSVELQLFGDVSDFTYQMKNKAGEIVIGDQEYGDVNADQTFGSDTAEKQAELECNSGKIEIQFYDER